MKKFTLGALSGIAAITLSVPVFAQISSLGNNAGNRATQRLQRQVQAPSQECVSALAAKEELHLENFDAINAARKSATQSHLTALNSAAAITDETQRQEALQKAHEEMRTAMENAMEPYAEEMQTVMENVRSACGNSMGMRDVHMGGIGIGLKKGGVMTEGFGKSGMMKNFERVMRGRNSLPQNGAGNR